MWNLFVFLVFMTESVWKLLLWVIHFLVSSSPHQTFILPFHIWEVFFLIVVILAQRNREKFELHSESCSHIRQLYFSKDFTSDNIKRWESQCHETAFQILENQNQLQSVWRIFRIIRTKRMLLAHIMSCKCPSTHTCTFVFMNDCLKVNSSSICRYSSYPHLQLWII